MPSKKDDLDSMVMLEAIKFHGMKLKEREKLREEIKTLGGNISKFIDEDYRGDSDVDASIKPYLVPAIQSTAIDDPKFKDLINAAVDLVQLDMYRVEHPRYTRLSQLNFLARYLEAVGAHSRVHNQVSLATEVNLSKGTKIHNFLYGVKSFFGGKKKSDDNDWGD